MTTNPTTNEQSVACPRCGWDGRVETVTFADGKVRVTCPECRFSVIQEEEP